MKFKTTVMEIMRKNVRKVNIDDTIEKAANIMKNDRIGSVIVTDGDVVAGILTTSDIVYKYVAQKKGTVVSDIMSSNIIKIYPDKTIEEAAQIMVKNNIEKLPVFDNDNMVGIVTSNDILKIEPALIEVLIERMKIGGSIRKKDRVDYSVCEVCENYSENLKEVDGIYKCPDCR